MVISWSLNAVMMATVASMNDQCPNVNVTSNNAKEKKLSNGDVKRLAIHLKYGDVKMTKSPTFFDTVWKKNGSSARNASATALCMEKMPSISGL